MRQSPFTTAWQAILSSAANPRAEPKRVSMVVAGLRFSAPSRTRTRQRAQTPTPPQELPSGTPARRATSSTVSLSWAAASRESGTNVTTFDAAFTVIWHLPTKLSSRIAVYYSMRTHNLEGSEMKPKTDETRIAEQIVSVLGDGVARACSAARDSIRYAVRGEGLKLRTIVLRRASLRRLLDDPARDVKIEYLQRDLLTSAGRRAEFRYPRHEHPVVRRTMMFPLASAW
jgi:hypothetical protein